MGAASLAVCGSTGSTPDEELSGGISAFMHPFYARFLRWS